MWIGIDNTIKLVKPGGRLFISIYNDQGIKSRFCGGLLNGFTIRCRGRYENLLLFHWLSLFNFFVINKIYSEVKAYDYIKTNYKLQEN